MNRKIQCDEFIYNPEIRHGSLRNPQIIRYNATTF